MVLYSCVLVKGTSAIGIPPSAKTVTLPYVHRTYLSITNTLVFFVLALMVTKKNTISLSFILSYDHCHILNIYTL